MTLNQLRYIITVAETGSINKAAGNLFISQSVLSTTIKNLEKELGHDIFIRSPKGIKLTPYGKILLSYMTPIDQQLKLLDNFLYLEGASSNQSLSLVSNGFPFLSHIWSRLYQKYAEDGLHIKHQECYGYEAINMVADNLADIAVVRLWDCYESVYNKQFESLKLEFHPIITLNIGVTVGPKNPLYYRNEEWVTPDLLASYPMVMYDYMDSGPFSDIFSRLQLKCSSSRFATTSRAAIYEAITYTDAYYLNSDYRVCRYYDMVPDLHCNPSQRILLLKDCEIKSRIGWIKKIDHSLTPVAQEAIEMVYDYLSEDTGQADSGG